MGVCGGLAVVDDCGVCSEGLTGHPSNIDKDCNGDCKEGTPLWDQGLGGTAYYDLNCGGGTSCVGGNTGKVECIADCAGIWGGYSEYDQCGNCDDNPANDSIQDCAGIWVG